MNAIVKFVLNRVAVHNVNCAIQLTKLYGVDVSGLPENFPAKMNQIKSTSSLSIVTGFGIANRKMAAQASQYADGFLVGSLFVKVIAEGIISKIALTRLAQSLNPHYPQLTTHHRS